MSPYKQKQLLLYILGFHIMAVAIYSDIVPVNELVVDMDIMIPFFCSFGLTSLLLFITARCPKCKKSTLIHKCESCNIPQSIEEIEFAKVTTKGKIAGVRPGFALFIISLALVCFGVGYLTNFLLWTLIGGGILLLLFLMLAFAKLGCCKYCGSYKGNATATCMNCGKC
ncbi:MAG TPA: hypothetical protein VNJ08_16330 [Bacteriovoracaceae bacterium]|nr:hypothetical protein [Bacteriovoracaceae bacterium]